MSTVNVNSSSLLRSLATRLGVTAGAEGAEAKQQDGEVLKGPSLTISDIHAQIRAMAALQSTEAMATMMDSVYQTMKAMVDNLAPSDKERLEKERRLEELAKLRRQLENKELSLETIARKFENIAIAAADRALLEANMATEAQPKA